MKKTLYFAATVLLGVFSLFISSCSDDNEEDNTAKKPVVTLNEVGEENSKTAAAGSDLHLEGDITAENGIKRIDIEIRPDSGSGLIIKKSFTEGKYIGVKNTTFHEHIDIPVEAPAGGYHLYFTVTDQQGQTETVESEISLTTDWQVKGNVSVKSLTSGELDCPESGIVYTYGHLALQATIKVKDGSIKSIKMNAKQENGDGEVAETDLTADYDAATGQLSTVYPKGEEDRIPLDQPTGTYRLNLVVTLENGETQTFTTHVEVSDKPFIENFEVGSGHGEGELNNHTGSLAVGNLHIAGDIMCVSNRLKKITMVITSKSDGKQLMTQTWDETNYSGAKYGGARNDHFHEHPVFPKDAKPGDYLFRFTVEDQEGLTYTRECNLKLVE